MEKYTVEFIFDGRLKITQPENGYRYTTDPILLCGHVTPGPGEKILDIGCGCGIMPLLLAHQYPDLEITGVEIQKELAGIALKNVRANHMAPHIHIIHKDVSILKKSDTGGHVDLIISNPPYRKASTGRLNPNPQKAMARHETTLTISTLFSKADQLLTPRGKIILIFPAERLFDLYQAMKSTRIRPVWIRFIHPCPGKSATRLILCGVKNTKSSCTVRPPLYLYDADQNLTREHKKIIYA